MVLGPFAETKGPRLPGRDPATQNSSNLRTALIGKFLLLGAHRLGLHLSFQLYTKNIYYEYIFMWVIYEKRPVLTVLDRLPADVLLKYDAWKRIIELEGPVGL